MERIRAGVVGCGQISRQYLENLTGWFPSTVEIVACSDLDAGLAGAAADEFGGAACTPEELYANPDVEVVLNLTNPWAHTQVNLAALQAGKHVYTEKPIALDRKDARTVLETAARRGLRLGCAPDTFLGAGLQTCIKLIDEGWIGTPAAVHGSIMMARATVPRYVSARIGGALLDMAPYYITAMVAMFGPVTRLAGFAARSFGERAVTDMRRSDYGERFAAEAPTTVAGTLEFASGVLGHLMTTVEGHRYGPELSVIGSEGVLVCNDPNMFGGDVVVERGDGERMRIPLTHQYRDRNRGLGLVEMMLAERGGRPHRAAGELGYHCLDVMLGLTESGGSGAYYSPERVCERPQPLRPGHVDSALL